MKRRRRTEKGRGKRKGKATGFGMRTRTRIRLWTWTWTRRQGRMRTRTGMWRTWVLPWQHACSGSRSVRACPRSESSTGRRALFRHANVPARAAARVCPRRAARVRSPHGTRRTAHSALLTALHTTYCYDARHTPHTFGTGRPESRGTGSRDRVRRAVGSADRPRPPVRAVRKEARRRAECARRLRPVSGCAPSPSRRSPAGNRQVVTFLQSRAGSPPPASALHPAAVGAAAARPRSHSHDDHSFSRCLVTAAARADSCCCTRLPAQGPR